MASHTTPTPTPPSVRPNQGLRSVPGHSEKVDVTAADCPVGHGAVDAELRHRASAVLRGSQVTVGQDPASPRLTRQSTVQVPIQHLGGGGGGGEGRRGERGGGRGGGVREHIITHTYLIYHNYIDNSYMHSIFSLIHVAPHWNICVVLRS